MIQWFEIIIIKLVNFSWLFSESSCPLKCKTKYLFYFVQILCSLIFPATSKKQEDSPNKQSSTVSPKPATNIYHPNFLPDSQADRLGERMWMGNPCFIINSDAHQNQWDKQPLSSEAFLCPYVKDYSSWAHPSMPPRAFSKAELTRHELFLLFFLFASL